MNRHIQQIARDNQIVILNSRDLKCMLPRDESDFLISFGSCALRRLRSVYLKPEGRPRYDYMVALHELGHIMNPVNGWESMDKGSYKLRLKDERMAWQWALANARPRVTDSDLGVAFESYMGHVLAPELDEVLSLAREGAKIRRQLDTLVTFPDTMSKLREVVRLEVQMSEIQDRWEEIMKEHRK